ncbi:MAG: neuraminidase-like domain-containing protein [Ginsengibacter sp.]
MPNYKIEGQVVNKTTNETLVNVYPTVIFQYKSPRSTRNLAIEADGKFRVLFDDNLWQGLPANAKITVLFFVKDTAGEVLPTDFSIIDLQRTNYDVILQVEVAEPLRQVSGMVRLANGTPAADVRVAVYDRDLNSEQLLGECETDRKGYYIVSYQSGQFNRAEKGWADLLVKVFGTETTALAVSTILFNAGPVETIDLTIPAERFTGPSEYEQYLDDTQPLLDGVEFQQLTNEQLAFLSNESGIQPERLTYLRLDGNWSKDNNLAPAVFYGLLRHGLPANLRRLLLEKPSRLRLALTNALAGNIMPAILSAQLEAIMARLAELALSFSFIPETDTNNAAPLGVLLSTSGLDSKTQATVVDFMLQHEGNDDIWDALATKGKIEAEELNTTRFTLESNTLVLEHMPTLLSVQTLRKEKSWTAASDLAQLTRVDWEDIATKSPAGDLPPGFKTHQDFAEEIAFRVEMAFSTAVIANRLAADPLLGDDDVNNFFADNPSFDLLYTPLEGYFKKQADLTKVKDLDLLAGKLKTFQRIAKVTPDRNRFALMQGLISKGFDSAFKINNANPDEVFNVIFAIGGESVANEILLKAGALVDASNIKGIYIRDLTIHGPAALPRLTSGGELPDWAKLFGTLSSCSCPHCRSVYSPAAYLVDLLQFLKKAPRTSDVRRIQDVLLGRRPDLVHLLLNCENANTPLPYIDLVNEILELQVSLTVSPGARPFYQTEGSTEADKARLRAAPAHLHLPAYDILKTATYPWILPFDLQHEEIKSFSKMSNVTLHEIFELFRHDEVKIARAHLGLSLTTWNLITNRLSGDTELAVIWGITGTDRTIEIIQQVPEILARTGLDYEALEQLITCRFFARFQLSIDRGSDPCSMADDQLVYWAGPDPMLINTDPVKRNLVFDLIHRFIRLQQSLGWTVETLSEVLMVRGLMHTSSGTTWSPDIDLVDLSKLIRLAARLHISVEKAAGLKDLLRLAPAVGTTRLELGYMIELSGINPFDDNADNPFDLDMLNRLLDQYDTIIESGLDLTELRYLLRHQDLTPAVFEPTTAMKTASLQNLYDGMLRSDTDFPATGLNLVADATEIAVENAAVLFGGLLNLMEEAKRNMYVNEFSVLLATQLESLFSGAKPRIESGPGVGIASGIAVSLFAGLVLPSYEEAVRIFPQLPVTLSHGVVADTVELFESRFTEAFSKEHAKWQKAIQAVVEQISSALNCSPGIISQLILPEVDGEGNILVPPMLHAVGTESAPAIEDFLALIRRRSDVPLPVPVTGLLSDVITPAEKILIRISKSVRLIQLLKITPEELTFIRDKGNVLGFPNLNDLPFTNNLSDLPVAEDSNATFTEWLALMRAKIIQRQLPAADKTLFQFLEMALDPDVQFTGVGSLLETVASNTGWQQEQEGEEPSEMLESLSLSFGFAKPEYGQPETYALLRTATNWLRQRSISLPTLQNLITEPPPADIELRNTLEAIARQRFPVDADWYNALTPGNDRLRESKRNALVAWLITNQGWQNVDRLYAHFLIDTEMSACQLSSRMVQASGAIQLFVQRCLMNLEPWVQLGTSRESAHWKQWLWMKNYRVWEANRKVFLYPENWIEPELRDDKSPFFKELENDLLQDEVTNESVDRAYRNYFAKLDDVDRLDIRGLFEEVKESGEKVLHVVGRSYSDSPVYYYCKRLADRTWTAWDKIDQSIEGDHIILIVYNGRLSLFWPKFLEFGPDTNKKWQISMAWSEYRAGIWQAAKVGRGRLIRAKLMKEDFAFRFDAEGPKIWVYEKMRTGGMKPDHYSVGRSGFILNFCSEDLDFFVLLRSQAQRILIHPAGSEAISMNFVATDPEETRLLINYHTTNDEITDLDATLPQIVEDIIGEAFIFGIFVAAVFASLLPGLRQRIDEIRDNGRPDTLLDDTRSVYLQDQEFRILPAAHFRQLSFPQPFFLDIESRSYLVSARTEWLPVGRRPLRPSLPVQKYQFQTFYHPYFCEMVKRFSVNGVETLLNRPASDFKIYRQLYKEGQLYDPAGQLLPNRDDQRFRDFGPTLNVWRDTADRYDPYPYEQFDFSFEGTYSVYNWELFFHIPLLVADRLSKNQRFEDAQRWFHYIFNPTDISHHQSPAKYWKVKPLFELAQQWEEKPETLEDMLRMLAVGNPELELQVDQWRNNPFSPHLLARFRPIAYMKTVVQKYLDNIIGWGDYLFQQDTMESINEATQLYILASEILGARPVTINREETAPRNYLDVQNRIDEFSNFLIDIETSLPPATLLRPGAPANEIPPNLVLYFCIPANEKLASYWDTVADRLFKVRHCMNIEGQVRQLALFAPPIDPALLVRARAMGLDLGDVINNALDVRLPNCRYQYLSQKAIEFCSEVRSLAGALLAALEKKDAEDLSLLRSRHEVSLLKLVKQVKDQQIQESKETLEGLQAGRKIAENRLAFYSSREFKSAGEENNISLLHEAHKYEITASALNFAASIAYLFPDITTTPPGSTFGGSYVGRALSAMGQNFGFIGSQYSFEASMASTMAGYTRRKEEWDLQADLAQKELDQTDKQILAAEIRLSIAELDKSNHEKQIEQSEEAQAFMKNKFTNLQLYSWMVSQVAALHYQAYRMAYDLARKTEKAAQNELGVEPSSFSYIQFGHWDSLRKGLLAGDRLQQDLRRMEAAYLEKNRREFELTKHISLSQINPLELVKLRERGECTITLPEVLFDLDFSGHYYRRIKSVSVSLPCIAGPYTTVSCTLRLVKNTIRINTSKSDANYGHNNEGGAWIDDDRFRESNVPVKAMATSTGQRDSGMFELSFRDERYLPFEGAGVISEWKIELTKDKELRQFDYSTISDVILHISYTAREDAGLFKENAVAYLKNFFTNLANSNSQPLMRMFSLKHEFSTEWHKFLYPADPSSDQLLSVTLKKEHFPFFTQNMGVEIAMFVVLIKSNKTGDYKMHFPATDSNEIPPTLTDDSPMPPEFLMAENALFENMQVGTIINASQVTLPTTLKFKFMHNSNSNYHSINKNPDELLDIFLVPYYKLG